MSEDNRIYLNVPYMARGFAKSTKCGFDSVKKLWFTSMDNPYLRHLIQLYGVNDTTAQEILDELKATGFTL